MRVILAKLKPVHSLSPQAAPAIPRVTPWTPSSPSGSIPNAYVPYVSKILSCFKRVIMPGFSTEQPLMKMNKF